MSIDLQHHILPSPTLIADACTNCQRKFNDYISNPRPPLLKQAKIERQRFIDWSQRYYVYASSVVTLDNLLEHEVELRNMLLRLLVTLARNIQRVIDASQEMPSSNDEDSIENMLSNLLSDFKKTSSRDSSSDSLATIRTRFVSSEEPLRAVKRNIKQLNMLSSRIHDAIGFIPGINFQKAHDWEKNALSVLQQERHSISQTLTKRMLLSLCLRFRRIVYLKSLARKGQDRTLQAGVGLTQTSILPSRKSALSPIQNTVSNEERNFAMGIDGDLLPGCPPPPPVLPSTEETLCPYCHCWLPHKVVTSPKLWWQHVLSKIQHFVCLSENCSQPLKLFKDEQHWLDHMGQHRGEWCCSAPSHSPITFKSSADFENHIMTQHPATVTKEQLPLISRNSRRPSAQPFEECPFCKSVEVDPADEKELRENPLSSYSVFMGNTTESSGRHVINHIQRHLGEFSFFCIWDVIENPLYMEEPLSGPASESSFSSDSGSRFLDDTLEEFESDLVFDDPPPPEDSDPLGDSPVIDSWDFMKQNNDADLTTDHVLAAFVEREKASSAIGLVYSDMKEVDSEDDGFDDVSVD